MRTILGFATINILFLFSTASCKKLTTVSPPTNSITNENVFVDNSTASAVLTGIYSTMSEGDFASGGTSISVSAGLAADELQGTAGSSLNSVLTSFYLNALTSTNAPFWSNFYSYIYRTNAAIEGIMGSQTLTDTVKTELLGEARFIRAFCYFYVVNLFGDAPLALSSNYNENTNLARSAQSIIYQQIITDLKFAQQSLNSKYVEADAMTVYGPGLEERIRPNKYAASALLAKVYLSSGDYADAAQAAASVINNTSLYNLTDLSTVFLKNSSEAIWQLQPTNGNFCTLDGNLFIMTAAPPSAVVWLNSNLIAAFENGDKRMSNWVGIFTDGSQNYYYPNKYKVKVSLGPTITEYLMVLRLAEQYLIRAEAYAMLGDLPNATNDINTIRNRAGLPNTTSVTQAELLSSITQERRIELFTEWGNRWIDLKRFGIIDNVMDTVCSQKGGTWNTDWKLWPILNSDVLVDPNLIQNTGY